MNYVKNVIDRNIDDETIDFLFRNSEESSIIHLVLTLVKLYQPSEKLNYGGWQFDYSKINKEV